MKYLYFLKFKLFTIFIIVLWVSLFSSTIIYSQWSEHCFINNNPWQCRINCITNDVKGNLYTGGFLYNDYLKYYVAKWDGVSWSELGGTDSCYLNGQIFCITTDSKCNLYAGGIIHNDINNYCVSKWVDTAWVEVGGKNNSTFNGYINCITSDTNGNLYTGGDFYNAKGYQFIAVWNGKTWEELGGTNTSTFNGSISCITKDIKGNIFVGGEFINGSGNHFIAKWNGKTWEELGGSNKSTFNDKISCIASDHTGNIYAAGSFYNDSDNCYVAKWNANYWDKGGKWDELGSSNLWYYYGGFSSIATDIYNNVYAAFNQSYSKGRDGVFIRNYFAKWDGKSWIGVGDNSTSTSSEKGAISCISTDSLSNILVAYGTCIGKYNITKSAEIISLNSKKLEKYLVLNWQTTSETNISNFIIQHSIDGISFTDIGIIQAVGSGANAYQFSDSNLLDGLNYYRLECVDKNSSVTYSKVLTIDWLNVDLKVIVYPNPAKTSVTIKGNHIISIELFDNVGRIVKNFFVQDVSNPIISVKELERGIYFLRVHSNNGQVHKGALLKE